PAPDSPVADVRSAVAVPMRWDGAVRGVLSVGFHRAHRTDPDDLRLLETFGELAAAACRNANAAAGLALAARTDALTGCLNHAAGGRRSRPAVRKAAGPPTRDRPRVVAARDVPAAALPPRGRDTGAARLVGRLGPAPGRAFAEAQPAAVAGERAGGPAGREA